jgi:MoaA/NifB/PqqE/SkfB family radical SAM enzyme
MTQPNPEKQNETASLSLSKKLWIYTNYDCNLKCTYCTAKSHPGAPRRAMLIRTVQRIIDEAIKLKLESVFFTGGEPFLLDNFCAMLAYSSASLPTTVLTNAMLFRGKRLKELTEIYNENITIQISLDGSKPKHHEPYRGKGTWQKTVDGLHRLLESGIRIRLSTTETPANTEFIEEICEYFQQLGIPEEDYIIRPLAKRGFSDEGKEVSKRNLAPEMTINNEGVYWHPLSTDPDMLVSAEIFPLSESISKIKTELEEIAISNPSEMEEFQ